METIPLEETSYCLQPRRTGDLLLDVPRIAGNAMNCRKSFSPCRAKASRPARLATSALAALTFMLPVLCLRLPAEGGRLRFEHVPATSGLTPSVVFDILQDHLGFMWFATENGLYRHDGYTFSEYRHVPGDGSSLNQNHVVKLMESKDGTLWIGTHNGGLSRFDPAADAFHSYWKTPVPAGGLSGSVVQALVEDRDGVLWVGTNNGLNRLDRATGSFTIFRHRPGDGSSLSHDQVNALCLDREGTLWIGTDEGLNRLRRGGTTFERHSHRSDDSATLSHDRILAILEDRGSALWIGTQAGLDRLDRRTGGCERLAGKRNIPPLLQVNDISEDRSGRLWIATQEGLLCGDPRSGEFSVFRHDPQDPYSLGYDQVLSICEDRSGILWIGNFGTGVDKVSANQMRFDHHYPLPGRADRLGNAAVFCFHEDPDRSLWIGTMGGLERLDPERRSFSRYPSVVEGGAGPSDRFVRNLLVDSRGEFWIGTDGGGLNRFDRRRNAFTALRHDPQDPHSLSDDKIRVLAEDRAGNLWVGTLTGGLNRLSRENNTFSRFQHDGDDSRSLGSNEVRAILQDRSGALWIGTYGGGLNRFLPETGTFARSLHDASDPAGLSSNYIFDLHEDREGNLWIATWGGGLNRLDAARRTFSHFTKRDGLPCNEIYGILEDRTGRLWLSTFEGLSRFDPRAGAFRNFDVHDGLQGNEFNFGARYLSPRGEMFFGGVNGFNAFFPEEITDSPCAPPVHITSFRILNREARLARPIWETDEIVIRPRDYLFSLEFAALDYSAPMKNRYAYKLEGLTDDWIETDARNRVVSFSTLAPGRYVLRVRGSSSDGLWSDREAALVIRVRGPWWKSWWFLSLLALTAALLVFELNRTRLRRRASRIRTQEAMDQLLDKRAISPREKEIVLLLLKGLSNKEIGEKLYIELSTVKIHVHHILGKLGVGNRTQLLRLFQNLKT